MENEIKNIVGDAFTRPIVYVVNIGNELLSGKTTNANLTTIGKKLLSLGLEINKAFVIPDTKAEIHETLSAVWKDNALVIITGGLGPTKDDITKTTIAEFFQKEMIFYDEIWDDIKEMFAQRKMQIPEINKVQAFIPKDFLPLKNEKGTAPALYFHGHTVSHLKPHTSQPPPYSVAKWGGKGGDKYYRADLNEEQYQSARSTLQNNTEGRHLFCLPGVPFEMEYLFDLYITPFIENLLPKTEFMTFDINTYGIGESKTAEMLEHITLEDEVNIAWLPHLGRVDIRLSGRNIKGIKTAFNEINEILKDYIWGCNESSPVEALHKELIKTSHTISTAESCTGGMLSSLLTKIPGSSKYFIGSVIAYSNQVKTNLLGISPQTLNNCGAVSEEAVLQMLASCREIFKTDIACAITGIAGPSGETKNKPVGTVYIAVNYKGKITVEKCFFTGNRDQIRQRATDKAIFMILKEQLRTVIRPE